MTNEPMIAYPARLVRTMDPGRPTGEAVLVRGDRVRAVGTLEELTQYGDFTIDDRYADAVLFPGFVEAHSHTFGGGIWEYTYVGFEDRMDPDGKTWPGCKSIEDVLRRLREADAALTDPDQPLLAWALDPIYYPGERMVARHLDTVSTTRPIYVMHQSGHHATVNSALMRKDGITRDTMVEGVKKDAAGEPVGELEESAAQSLATSAAALANIPFSEHAIRSFAKDARNHGATTAVDLGNRFLWDPAQADEIVAVYEKVLNDPATPLRMPVFAFGLWPGTDPRKLDEAVATLVDLRSRNTDKLKFGYVKFVLDGTVQGMTARVLPPGYLGKEGNGIWNIDPDRFRQGVIAAHKAGLNIHVHCNGDEATELFLDATQEALSLYPRWNHRHTVTHSQLTTPAQYRRMRELGMGANIFANHLWAWGDQHLDISIGIDRASRMDAARTAIDAGVPISLHCDTPVTPLNPLLTAAHAVTRRTQSGRIIGEHERITVPEALQAVTLGAAYLMHVDHEVGSISAGKFADFAVLDADPYVVDGEALREITVHGTVVGGTHHEAASS